MRVRRTIVVAPLTWMEESAYVEVCNSEDHYFLMELCRQVEKIEHLLNGKPV